MNMRYSVERTTTCGTSWCLFCNGSRIAIFLTEAEANLAADALNYYQGGQVPLENAETGK